jgi:hypothetical protein
MSGGGETGETKPDTTHTTETGKRKNEGETEVCVYVSVLVYARVCVYVSVCEDSYVCMCLCICKSVCLCVRAVVWPIVSFPATCTMFVNSRVTTQMSSSCNIAVTLLFTAVTLLSHCLLNCRYTVVTLM